MITKIQTLQDIDYKDKAEGTLLFIALSILTVDKYPDKTPDEVIALLDEKFAYKLLRDNCMCRYCNRVFIHFY